MRLNIPVWITLLRVITIPFFVVCFYLPFSLGPSFSAIIFCIASLTDWLDGFLARRWQQITLFGTFLDPVIDKIIVVIALILIVEYFHIWWITLPAASIIIREIFILALREWVAKFSCGVNIIVSWISKFKTATQMVALILLLWHPHKYCIICGVVVLYIAVFLTMWSISVYLYIVYKNFLDK